MRRKFDRFSSRSRVAAACLAALLLASGPGASGITIQFKFGNGGGPSRLSRHLAQEIGQVEGRFGQNRATLPTVTGPGGVPAYPRQAVLDLIDATGKDLDQAILRVQEPKLAGLEAWAAEGFQRIRGGLATPGGTRTAAVSSGRSGRAGYALVSNPGPAPDTIDTARSGQLLDQVEKVIGRLFFLADKDDLEVKLWVGSTPAEHATFRFWSQASAHGSAGGPASPAIIRTDGRRDHVLRGLYSYSVALGSGPVTELLASDQPGGAGGAGGVGGVGGVGGPGSQASEKLDLVNGSSFFCCRFEEKYCHHVDNENECQAH